MTNGILDSSQKIVTDALVLNYDIAQLRSYPTTGTAVTDLSGSGTTGTLINGVAFNSGNGGTLLFDGVNDYMDLGSVLNYTSGNFSFSYWIYFISLVGNGATTCWKGSYGTVGYYDQITPSGIIGFQTNQSGVVQSSSAPTGTIVINNWYNICYVRNGPSIRIYVNGIDKTGTAGTHVDPATSTNSFRISNYNNGQFYGNYYLSQFANYNKALSSTEITQNFNANRLRYGL
jgi:hypothetical protein